MKAMMKTKVIALAALTVSACTQPKEQPADADCDTWCDVRESREETESWCPIDGFGEDARDCLQVCETLGQEAPLESLQHCIEEDALCFIAVNQCIVGAERQTNCATWCDYRTAEHANEGFCDPILQGVPDRECVSICISALQQDLAFDSVQECVRNNPLCFTDLEDCTATDSPEQAQF